MGKKRNKILKEFKPAFQLAGASIGSSILGGATQKHIPTGVQNPLTTLGSATGKFIPVVAIAGVTSLTAKQLKKLEKKLKRRKK